MSSTNNRILKGSVSFSNEPTTFDFSSNQIYEEHLQHKKKKPETEDERKAREMREFLEQKENYLNEREAELIAFQAQLQEAYEQFEKDRDEAIQHLNELEEEHERTKRRDYYDMREFMWETSIDMAQQILNQKIAKKDFSFKNIYLGMLERLPIEINELEISVHPDTLIGLQNETFESWMFENIKWKYDYSLELGEFVVEDENGYYDNRFAVLFNEIRRRLSEESERMRGEE